MALRGAAPAEWPPGRARRHWLSDSESDRLVWFTASLQARVGGNLLRRFCRLRVGGHRLGRFCGRPPSPPAGRSQRDAGRSQLSTRGFSTHAGGPLDTPQRPSQPPQCYDLLFLSFLKTLLIPTQATRPRAGGFAPKDLTDAHASVFQFPFNFTGTTVPVEANVGAFSSVNPMYSGAFDNTYFTSANAASPTGYLYVCGNPGDGTGLTGHPVLYQIPITNNVMSTTSTSVPPVVAGPTVSAANTTCSPVTEFFNGSTLKDHIYLSPKTEGTTGVPTGCSASTGCVIAYDVTNPLLFTSASTPSSSAPEAGGTSAIIIDNSNNFTGASQIYFSTLANQSCPTSGGTGGCAIQLSQ
jgi:hypothetical protein